MSIASIAELFYIDMLSKIMIYLVGFIGIIVYFFSKKYMHGDTNYNNLFKNMLLLLLSVVFISAIDNLLLFLCAWACCNWTLVKLIVHKSSWKAAKASGILAAKNFILGFIFITLAFAFMYKATGSTSINYIVNNPQDSWYTLIALIMLLLGAMTQSAIWPFHRWLISSLNAPTPVSALMHAGIVNGGGVLLALFAPLYFNSPIILNIIFIIGLITALLGSLWKLMQHDVKRMLACSTMGQMGFMLAQCGLGLFGAAIAHLCWHGMFKAYLFLASGGAAQEKRLDLGYPPSLISFLFSLICGALGSYIFTLINSETWFPLDSTLVIVGIVFIASSQLSLTILSKTPIKSLPLAMLITAIMAAIYGANFYVFDLILLPLELMQPQALNAIHICGLSILVFAWMFILFMRHSKHKNNLTNFALKLYVKALNSSQPHSSTITTHRKGYNYV
jgi:NAD(P)H-quinone oxidoreductase subunit 5